MSTARTILAFFGVGVVIYAAINLVTDFRYLNQAIDEKAIADDELELANKDLAYAYGECVFYHKQTVEFCNNASHNKGLPLYEKYYGDGSWTYTGGRGGGG